MLGHVEVLLSHEHTLAKEVLVNLLAVRLWDKPFRKRLAGHCDDDGMFLHCWEFLALFGESHTMLMFFLGLSKVIARFRG